MKYKIYANIETWKIVDIKPSLEEAIKVLEDILAIEITDFIVIESSIEKGDFPIICTMKSYLRIKEELEKDKKVKRLIK